ncbi:LysR substrate-binding domain-containing protein, partial [Streptomyces sp. LUP30]|uniref:LysR substrate-binding domain-containing protein n=1 Tax=Streptomyces sp. LUP30 TaxID=1890285 RepID=UPI003521CF09
AGCPRCRGQLVQVCERAGFTPRIDFATDDYPAVVGLVGAGLGVAVLPELAPALRRSPPTAGPRSASRTAPGTAVPPAPAFRCSEARCATVRACGRSSATTAASPPGRAGRPPPTRRTG